MVKNIAVCVVIDSTRFTQTYLWTTIKAATISDRITEEAVFSKHGTLILESCQWHSLVYFGPRFLRSLKSLIVKSS